MTLRNVLRYQRGIVGSSFVIGMGVTVLCAFICYCGYALFYPEGLKSLLGISIPVLLPALVAPPVAGLIFYHLDLAHTETTKREMLAKQLHQEIERRRQVEEDLVRYSNCDPLTGLANRNQFETRLRRGLSRSKRHDRPLSVVMIGIDNFTELNRRFGHEGGDVILKQVAKTVRSEIREEDFAARFADDRFVLVLEDTPLNGAQIASNRVRAAIEDARVAAQGELIQVTACFGVAEVDARTQTVADSIAWGEHALAHARMAGANKVCIVRDPNAEKRAAQRPAVTPGRSEGFGRASEMRPAAPNAPNGIERRATLPPIDEDAEIDDDGNAADKPKQDVVPVS